MIYDDARGFQSSIWIHGKRFNAMTEGARKTVLAWHTHCKQEHDLRIYQMNNNIKLHT